MSPAKIVLTPAEEEQIIVDDNRGVPVDVTAAKLGISRVRLQEERRSMGIEGIPGKRPAEGTPCIECGDQLATHRKMCVTCYLAWIDDDTN